MKIGLPILAVPFGINFALVIGTHASSLSGVCKPSWFWTGRKWSMISMDAQEFLTQADAEQYLGLNSRAMGGQ